MAAVGHLGCPKFTFDRISGNFRSIRNLIFLKILTKWLPSAILDVRNSLSIAFLDILDQYATLIFVKILTKWLPSAILDVRNSLSIASLAILDQYGILFFFGNFLQNGCRHPFWKFFTKWPPAPILDVWNSLSIAFLAILDRYRTLFFLEIFDKMAAVGHFGCPKFTFNHISGNFRSIRNLNFV